MEGFREKVKVGWDVIILLEEVSILGTSFNFVLVTDPNIIFIKSWRSIKLVPSVMMLKNLKIDLYHAGLELIVEWSISIVTWKIEGLCNMTALFSILIEKGLFSLNRRAISIK